MFTFFEHIPFVYPLYFLYGAIFLFLGSFISLKDMEGSDLKLAQSLRFLGMFGFAHGIHEWFVLFPLIQGEHLTLQEIFAAKAITVSILLLSFLLLLKFGLQLVRDLDRERKPPVKGMPLFLLLLLVFYLWNHGFRLDMLFLWKAELGARITFGFAAGLLTSYGLIEYSREVRTLSRFASKKLFYAGVAFGCYSIVAGVFPSHIVVPYLAVPVEVLRGLSALLITYFIIKALNIFDIETRKKSERHMRRIVQTEKLSSLGLLAAGIAHEINNPLTNASLGIQTIRNKIMHAGISTEIAEKLDGIEENIDRASEIVRELLLFSRQRESELIPVNINDVVHGSLTLMRHELTHISVHENLSVICGVMGDPVKLEQAFINILSNAVEAMQGSGIITITTSQDNGMVRIRVSDTGSGIQTEHLSRVFDPFYTTKEIGEGTGLGLSICYGIIRQHRGTIEIMNHGERGAIIAINLPAGEENEKDTRRG